jgi:aminopeptidase N
MENTSATFLVDMWSTHLTGFEDRNYQSPSGKHHWLEGATYYAALAEREIYGDDYFYSKLYETAQQIKYASRTDTIPVLNEKASSLSFIKKGLGFVCFT